MKKWVCGVCGWIYDESLGDSDYGLEPGVAFKDLPDDFVCPLCGVGKDQFEELNALSCTTLFLHV